MHAPSARTAHLARLAAGLLLVAALATSLVSARQVADPPGQPRTLVWADEAAGQLVFFAVLEGLYLEGVQTEVVRAVLDGDPARAVFVPGCPVCTPALVAFELYASRGPLHVKQWDEQGRMRDSFGPGLTAADTARLTGSDRAERLAALEALITRWVGQRLDRLRATPDERAAFALWLEDGRKLGMGSLAQYRQGLDDTAAATWKTCAFCDGSVAGCDGR